MSSAVWGIADSLPFPSFAANDMARGHLVGAIIIGWFNDQIYLIETHTILYAEEMRSLTFENPEILTLRTVANDWGVIREGHQLLLRQH